MPTGAFPRWPHGNKCWQVSCSLCEARNVSPSPPHSLFFIPSIFCHYFPLSSSLFSVTRTHPWGMAPVFQSACKGPLTRMVSGKLGPQRMLPWTDRSSAARRLHWIVIRMELSIHDRRRSGFAWGCAHTRLTSFSCSMWSPQSAQDWRQTRDERSGCFSFQLFLSTFDCKKAEGARKRTAGSPPRCGPKSHESVCCSLYDLSTLSGPVHEAPGNPARTNMVAAMSIDRHTHNHMPPLSFQWAWTTFTFSSFQQTPSMQTPCGGARVKRMTHYKVAPDTHTHSVPSLCFSWAPVGWTEEMWISVINAEVNIAQRRCWPLVVFLVWCLS